MENEDGLKHFKGTAINNMATNYYKNLYGHEKTKTATDIIQNELRESNNEPDILERELQIIIKNLKKGKAPGVGKITNEQLKHRRPNLNKLLTVSFNKILKSGKIPTQWKHSEIILIPKKGNIHQIKNYRPISLSLTIVKVFSKLKENRIRPFINIQQTSEEAGFRQN